MEGVARGTMVLRIADSAAAATIDRALLTATNSTSVNKVPKKLLCEYDDFLTFECVSASHHVGSLFLSGQSSTRRDDQTLRGPVWQFASDSPSI
jgi:hypothetical protein